MRRIRVQRASINEIPLNGQQHNLIKDLLKHRGAFEPPSPVLAEHRMVRNLVPQAESKEPTIGHVDLNLLDQLPFGTNPEQVAKHQHLEKNNRVNRGPTVVQAIKPLHLLVDEAEIDGCFYLAQKMVGWHQFLDAHKLHFRLPISLFL